MPEPKDQSSEALIRSLVANTPGPGIFVGAALGCMMFCAGAVVYVRSGSMMPTWIAFGIGVLLWVMGIAFAIRRGRKLEDPEWLAFHEEMMLDFADKHDIAEAHAIRFIRDAQGKQRQLLDKRHAENRAMKQMVLEWWSANKDRPGITKDAAAHEMAGSLVPLPFRTVRGYLKGL